MGTVKIDDLRVSAVIGTLEYEKLHRQQLIIGVEFDYDSRRAAQTDDLFASVDYSAVERKVVENSELSRFELLETLALHLGKTVLGFAGVTRVKISIGKPAASAFGAMISYSEEFFAEA